MVSGASVGGKTDEEAFEKTHAGCGECEIEKRIASRKLLANASYYAFTATPKTRLGCSANG